MSSASGCGVNQHVLARLDGLAILRAPDLGIGRYLPAERVDRVGRIIDERVRRRGGRRTGRWPPVAADRVGPPAAVQIELGELRSSQRPFIFVAPFAGAHHKNSQRGFLVDPGRQALQPIVVPAEVFGLRQPIRSVNAGAHAQPRAAANGLVAALLAKAFEVAEVLVDQVVVPAGDEIGRRLDSIILVLDAERFPMVVVPRVLHPKLDPLGLRVGNAIGRRHQRQGEEMRIADRNMPLEARRAGGEQPVREDDVQLQHAVVVLVAEKALLPFDRQDARQVRIGQRRAHDLRERIVRLAEHAHLARAPRLPADPLLGIEAVAGSFTYGSHSPSIRLGPGCWPARTHSRAARSCARCRGR